MKSICLDKGWRLLEAPLAWDKTMLPRVMSARDGWMDCDLPCDVHMPLQAAGRIGDVVEADNCFAAEWTEHRSWWFARAFDSADVDMDAEVIEITLTMLDAHADIFLNGEWLGAHESAFYPFTASVKSRLREGKNVLAARVTTGLENVSDADMAVLGWECSHEKGNGCPERGDIRRPFVRRPQYSVGWDWAPKAVTCGITGHAFLRAYRKTAIRGAHAVTRAIDNGDASVRITLEVENTALIATRDADISVSIALDGDVRARADVKDCLLLSGVNFIDMDVTLPDARLWWPAGSGDQPLYEVRGEVVCGGETEILESFLFGVRTIALDTSRVDDKRRNFRFIVNGREIFCKGGDWIPSDSIYARITKEKYDTLIDEAKEANFNMLRIWGGGFYETEEFYAACDRDGILIWHDFMFSCAAYPDHDARFQTLVEKEMLYQVRRLRNHACMALWCGNNEDHWLCSRAATPEMQRGMYAANTQARRVLRACAPEIPYWNSSPYGGDAPNDPEIGDVHHWHACMMNPEMAKRIEPKEYDAVAARFVSEYGYPGPCVMDSVVDYHGGAPIDRQSRVWQIHNNTFEKKTVAAGIVKHYRDDAAALSLEDYLLYAGMVQSLMLGYSLEAIRFKDFCGGALFWMYNDAWGEVGWTIIDYYMRRKISYYGVKRAFAPVKLTLREEAGKVRLQGANDTGEDVSLDVDTGWMSFDGRKSNLTKRRFTLPAHSRAYLLEEPAPTQDPRDGTYVALSRDPRVEPAQLYRGEARNRRYEKPCVHIDHIEVADGDLLLTVSADVFVHGAYIDTKKRCSDNYFDLIPGCPKKIAIYGGADTPPRIDFVARNA